MPKEGKFIVFEGIDGSGKGTQASKALFYIFEKDKGNSVLLTREPWTSEYGKQVRERLKTDTNPIENAIHYADLFVMDRKEHLKEIVEPNVKKGTHVICDRYMLSTLAYQSTQGAGLQRLITMHCFDGFREPDLTLLLDLPAETALRRRTSANASAHAQEEVFEKLQFQERLRTAYQEIFMEYIKSPKALIDASGSIEQTFGRIKKEIDRLSEYK